MPITDLPPENKIRFAFLNTRMSEETTKEVWMFFS
jgi:hypothetical protein